VEPPKAMILSDVTQTISLTVNKGDDLNRGVMEVGVMKVLVLFW
jgi:hypothetical protein